MWSGSHLITEDVERELTGRMGMRMFIARSVPIGKALMKTLNNTSFLLCIWILQGTSLVEVPTNIPRTCQDDIEEALQLSVQIAMPFMSSHNDNVRDSRTGLFDSDLNGIRKNLHPNLVSLGRLLFELLEQVCPEYALLEPPSFKAHLHEAFRRLFLTNH